MTQSQWVCLFLLLLTLCAIGYILKQK